MNYFVIVGRGNSPVLSKVFFVLVVAGIIEPTVNQMQHQLDLDAAACLLLIAFMFFTKKKLFVVRK